MHHAALISSKTVTQKHYKTVLAFVCTAVTLVELTDAAVLRQGDERRRIVPSSGGLLIH